MHDVTDEAIISQIRDWADDLACQVPPWAPTASQYSHPDSSTGRRAGSRYVLAVAVAAMVVLAGVAVVWRGGPGTDADLTDQGGTISVIYEKVEYRQSASLNCPGGSLPDDGLDEATFETWGDRSGTRWRNTVSYPDGATRDLVLFGIPWYPTESYSRGEPRGAALGCTGPAITFLAEPGQYTFFSLNPLTDVPTIEEALGQSSSHGGTSLTVPGQEQLAVPGYEQLGVSVPGEHTDSQGRQADLWRDSTAGFIGEGAERRRSTQTTDWLVDRTTGEVLEKSYTSTIEGLGSATSTLTLITTGTTTVADTWFDTDGYQVIE